MEFELDSVLVEDGVLLNSVRSNEVFCYAADYHELLDGDFSSCAVFVKVRPKAGSVSEDVPVFCLQDGEVTKENATTKVVVLKALLTVSRA